MAGDAIGTYGKSMGMPLDETKYFTSFTGLKTLAQAMHFSARL
jgi:hypothetical protein